MKEKENTTTKYRNKTNCLFLQVIRSIQAWELSPTKSPLAGRTCSNDNLKPIMNSDIGCLFLWRVMCDRVCVCVHVSKRAYLVSNQAQGTLGNNGMFPSDSLRYHGNCVDTLWGYLGERMKACEREPQK